MNSWNLKLKNLVAFALVLQNEVLRCKSKQYFQNIYMENYKTLMKEIKKIKEVFHIHGLENPIFLMLSVLLKLVYRLNAIPKSISICEYRQIGSKVDMERQSRPRTANAVLKEKEPSCRTNTIPL